MPVSVNAMVKSTLINLPQLHHAEFLPVLAHKKKNSFGPNCSKTFLWKFNWHFKALSFSALDFIFSRALLTCVSLCHNPYVIISLVSFSFSQNFFSCSFCKLFAYHTRPLPDLLAVAFFVAYKEIWTLVLSCLLLQTTSLSSVLFSRNHRAVLLFENKIIPSSANVVALGFSLSKRSSLAKSLSLMVLELGTDFISSTSCWFGLSSTPPGRSLLLTYQQ